MGVGPRNDLIILFRGRDDQTSSRRPLRPFQSRGPRGGSHESSVVGRFRCREPRREIFRGLDEDMILHREIGGFSAGQKSKLTLGAAFWTTLGSTTLEGQKEQRQHTSEG